MAETVAYDPNHSLQLKAASLDIANYHLPELPESEAQEVYERISQREAQVASRGNQEDGYRAGTASIDDQIYTVRGTASGLLTAEHATTQIRDGVEKDADWGTAGLGHVIHEDTGAGFVVAVGRQTSDANTAPEHPLKDEVRGIMLDERPLVIAGLHGMAAGKFNDLTDTKAFDVFVGIGDKPNERTTRLADAVEAIAEDLGLRLGINQKFIQLNSDGSLKPFKKVEGQPERPGPSRNSFSAKGEHTTRAFEQRVAEEISEDLDAEPYEPALMQVELSSLLRRQPVGLELDPKSREMGAYLGYLFTKRLIELGQNPDF